MRDILLRGFSASTLILPELQLQTLGRWMMRRNSEIEAKLIPILAAPDRSSLDVGASEGWYTFPLLRYSSRVYAFEPRMNAGNLIELGVRRLPDRITLLRIALSDKDGTQAFRIVEDDPSLSTLEQHNILNDVPKEVITGAQIQTSRLDSLDLNDVGLIKIDVEGHELSVLEGGKALIAECRPNIIIEIEERHRPGALCLVTNFFADLGYSGIFRHRSRLCPISEFEIEQHQRVDNLQYKNGTWTRRGVYVNNFIFIPNESLHDTLNKISSSGV
jgi:FkbM family methyltransferase